MLGRLGWALAAGVLTFAPAAVAEETVPPEITELIGRWYAELQKLGDGRAWNLMAPGFIDAAPFIDYADTGSAALGRPLYTSLAARAPKFAYRVVRARHDSAFAKVEVDERGYFCAWAIPTTYETAASTTFLLELQDDGRWLILAHGSSSYGFHPDQSTVPLPDMCAGQKPPSNPFMTQ